MAIQSLRTLTLEPLSDVLQRTAFSDALTWLEIHGNAPETLEY